MLDVATVSQRLLLSLFLAGIIGYDRERHGRAAGFRTHILVALGSALVMLTGLAVQERAVNGSSIDPTRMASQVVSGIGFLGAGTILQSGMAIRGLTTAASLWVVAGIGIAAGVGFWEGAVLAGLLSIATLFGLAHWEQGMRIEKSLTLVLETIPTLDVLSPVKLALAENRIEIENIDVEPSSAEGMSSLVLQVRIPPDSSKNEILRSFEKVKGVKRARWG